MNLSEKSYFGNPGTKSGNIGFNAKLPDIFIGLPPGGRPKKWRGHWLPQTLQEGKQRYIWVGLLKQGGNLVIPGKLTINSPAFLALLRSNPGLSRACIVLVEFWAPVVTSISATLK